MKVKTSTLKDQALDWAVAKCEQMAGMNIREGFGGSLLVVDADDFGAPASFSTNWAQGGPIIEREKISLDALMGYSEPMWMANQFDYEHLFCRMYGHTPLIVAMRCYVASKLGDEVEIPEELHE